MTDFESYLFGLLITDGSLYLTTRNRGRVTIELNKKDEDIITKLYNSIPNSHIRRRVRNTNFKENYETVCFSNTRKEFRDMLISFGFPTKNKTLLAAPPTKPYNEYCFWRGVLDGDGSLGYKHQDTGDVPFVSLVTKSEPLKINYINFLNKVLGITKSVNRNKRDNVYNIVLLNENAQDLAKLLYLTSSDCDLHLNRKYDIAVDIQNWKRTVEKRII